MLSLLRRRCSSLLHIKVGLRPLSTSVAPAFNTLLYDVDAENRVAYITLNRPSRMNAINVEMPGEIRRAVEAANDDDSVHVIVLKGAGEGFCSGYDLKEFAEDKTCKYNQSHPWNPMRDYKLMRGWTDDYMSLFHSHKPTICQIHKYAVAGGSDLALSCDLVVMEDAARIGYPPSRVWGCPTTAMWVYRVGPEKAKRMLFTGDLVTGTEAKAMGLVLDAVPREELEERVTTLAHRISSVPRNQLMMQKLVLNHAVQAQGLHSSQTLATIFDGMTRHSREGEWFRKYAEEEGFKNAVKKRDSGEKLPDFW